MPGLGCLLTFLRFHIVVGLERRGEGEREREREREHKGRKKEGGGEGKRGKEENDIN